MTGQIPLGETGRGGLSGTTLKTIAIVAMFIDHAARAFVSDYYSPLGLALHMIGRITGPTMFFFIAEGYHKTRNANRYTLRMAVFALASYLPFIYFRTGGLPNADNWYNLNVIYTLTLGLLMLRARHEVKDKALSTVLVALCLVLALPGDWGSLGLVYILVFDTFHGDYPKQALGYTAVTLAVLLPSLARFVTGLFQKMPFENVYPNLAMAILYMAFFLPLLLLLFYNAEKRPQRAAASFMKWFFYLFYPLHLALLGWLQTVIDIRL